MNHFHTLAPVLTWTLLSCAQICQNETTWPIRFFHDCENNSRLLRVDFSVGRLGSNCRYPSPLPEGCDFSADLGRVNGEGVLPVHELHSHVQGDIVEGRDLVRSRAAREKLSWSHPAVLRVPPSCLFHGTPPETLEMEQHGASLLVGLHCSHHYDKLHHPLPCCQSWPCFDHSIISCQGAKSILLYERKSSRHENVI